MRGLGRLVWTEFKLTLRDPMVVFWSIGFPALWLLLMTVVIGVPIPGFRYEGMGFASFVFPASLSLVILSSSFVGVPLTLTTYRETAVLRRLRVTPVRTLTLALGFSLSQLAFVVVGILIVSVIGVVFLGVRIAGSPAVFAAVTLAGIVTFLALGSAVGSVAASVRSANVIIWTAFTPMLLLSELFLPTSLLPAWLRPIARALPLTALNTLLRDIVYGAPLADLWRLAVLAGWIVAAAITTARWFRWE